MNKEELNELLLNAKWKTSSSKKYEKLPHQYSLKETWTDENLFYKVCKAIRALGIKKPFFRTFFTYYCTNIIINACINQQLKRHSPCAN